MDTSKNLSCVHQQVFENWPETQSREKRKSTNDQDRRNEQTGKQSTGYRECADGLWNWLLLRQAPGNGENRNDHEEPTEQVSSSCRRVVPHGVCADPTECRPIGPRRRTVRLKHLRQSMWPGSSE